MRESTDTLPAEIPAGTAREPRSLEFLHPGRALSYGYAVHVVEGSNGHRPRSPSHQLAGKVVEDFLKLSASEGEDRNFLMGIRAQVNSFAAGLARCKRNNANAEQEIEEEYALVRGQIHNERIIESVFDLVKKGLAPTAFGALGALLAYKLAPVVAFVSPVTAEFTGKDAPSLIAGIMFAAVWTFGRKTWLSHKQERAYTRHQSRLAAARRAHEKAKLAEHEFHHAELVKLWEEYTGRQCDDAFGYGDVIRDWLRNSSSLGHGPRRKPSLLRQLGLRVLARLKRFEGRAAQ